MEVLLGDRVALRVGGTAVIATVVEIVSEGELCCVSFVGSDDDDDDDECGGGSRGSGGGGGGEVTAWAWLDGVALASSHDHESLHLRTLADLSSFGRWNPRACMWERRWTMPPPVGRVIRVFEDPSSSGLDGEGILWPSAVTLSRLICCDDSLQERLRDASSVVELVRRALGVGVGAGTCLAWTVLRVPSRAASP